MRHFPKDILKHARPETKPELPRKIRLMAKFFGKQNALEYIWNYYERESEKRVPFYLPYIYMKEIFDYLRRCAQIPKKQISMVLIDDEDGRIDYFLYHFLEELNYLTIVTPRGDYFAGLQERAFQELGLIIDVVLPWEEKNLRGNLVWDFSEQLQKEDCYPAGSLCFMPHKKPWKIQELLRSCEKMTAVSLKKVNVDEQELSPTLAEALLVPAHFPFRESRCEELALWCKTRKWALKLKVEEPKNLDI